MCNASIARVRDLFVVSWIFSLILLLTVSKSIFCCFKSNFNTKRDRSIMHDYIMNYWAYNSRIFSKILKYIIHVMFQETMENIVSHDCTIIYATSWLILINVGCRNCNWDAHIGFAPFQPDQTTFQKTLVINKTGLRGGGIPLPPSRFSSFTS